MSEKLREQRAKLVADQRVIIDKADQAARGMTTEEMSMFDKLNLDIDTLGQTIERADRIEAITKITKQCHLGFVYCCCGFFAKSVCVLTNLCRQLNKGDDNPSRA